MARIQKMKIENILIIVIVVLIVLIVLYWLFTSMRRNVRESFECKDSTKNDIYTGTNKENCFNKYELNNKNVIKKWLDSKGNRFSYKLKAPINTNGTKYEFVWNNDSKLHTTDKPDEYKYVWSDNADVYRDKPQPTTRAPTTTTPKPRTDTDYSSIETNFTDCTFKGKSAGVSTSGISRINNIANYQCGAQGYAVNMNDCKLPVKLQKCVKNGITEIKCKEKAC